MRRLSKAQGILFFYLFDLALLLLLALSFLPFMHGKQVRSRETALLNPASRERIRFIDLSRGEDGSLFSRRTVGLMKVGGTWLGSSSDGNGEFLWPADAQAVERLVGYASELVKAYEKASSRRDWEAFGLRERDAFSLVFSDASRSELSRLFFGNEDALTGRVYVRSSADDRVYEVDAAIGAFLSAEESFWADPFLYPQCLTGLRRDEAELMLRRGRLENVRPREGLPTEYEGRISFGNGASISFSVYRKDASYVVIPKLIPGPAFSEADRRAVESINYRYGISGATLERLREECSLSD